MPRHVRMSAPCRIARLFRSCSELTLPARRAGLMKAAPSAEPPPVPTTANSHAPPRHPVQGNSAIAETDARQTPEQLPPASDDFLPKTGGGYPRPSLQYDGWALQLRDVLAREGLSNARSAPILSGRALSPDRAPSDTCAPLTCRPL